ncbi:MAG: DUF2079 domain-containing protein [Candidatus Bathyarchaeia archaeon]
MKKLNVKIRNGFNILKKITMEIRNFIENKADILVFIPILLYAIIFSYYTLLKHYTFNSYAWDLGIFNQALYTTLYHGKLLFSTAELFMHPSGSYLATHFSPILFTLLPIYALYPSAELLIVFKSFILALGALPLYFLVKEILKDRKAAFIFAVAYLLHPAIQGSNWFDFQQQIFIPIFLFSSIYFMNKEKWKSYFIAIALSLTISEHATLAVLALSIYYLLTSNIRKIPYSLKTLKVTRETSILITVLMCLISFYISEYIKGLFPIQPKFIEMYRALGAYRVLGFKGESLILLPIYILLNPGKALNAILYDYTMKLIYIVLLFGPLAFLPFGSKITIVTFALLSPFLVSNYPAYYKIGAHYPLYVVVPIFLAAIDTLSNRTKKDVNSALKIIMAASLIFIISTSPISPMSNPLLESKVLWYPLTATTMVVSSEVKDLHQLLDMVPKDASILTQNNIFPHVSSRINAYVLPPSSITQEQIEILKDYVRDLINKSEYILLNIRQKDYWTRFTFNEVLSSNLFGPYAFTKWAILFKRGYEGPTQITYPNNEIVFSTKDFNLNFGSMISDASSKSGSVAFCPKDSKQGIFIYGPYIFLPNGVYNVTWRVKFGPHGEGHLATFEVTEKFGEVNIAKKYVYGFDVESKVWTNITLTFGVSEVKSYVEFRVYSRGAADISVDYVVLRQISGELKEVFVMKTFNYMDLKVNGKVTGEGILLRSSTGGEDAWSFWYGPYITLTPGKYRVTFNLKVTPSPNPNDRVIRLEVTKNHGAEIISGVDILGRDIVGNMTSSGWCKIKLEFSLDMLAEEIEFRGVDPSRKHDLYLAYILLEKI